MTEKPVLWSFRRCPYAMRARHAVICAGVPVALREIQLKRKPQMFLETSPSGTVPCLEDAGTVIDESLEIMVWALEQYDPAKLLQMPEAGWALIEENDGPFKRALDHSKYFTRYPDLDRDAERAKAAAFLHGLDQRLDDQNWLFGRTPRLADFAILPFVRQFANSDRAWFDAQPWPNVIRWLEVYLASAEFEQVMQKHEEWRAPGP
ncbi:MAG: glutathione S-transferase [Roseobacter sp.]